MPMNTRLKTLLPLLLAMCGLTGFAAQATAGDPAPLLKYVPPSANAVLLMDAEAVLKTSLARQNGWARKHKAIAADRPVFLPPEAGAIVIASQLDPLNDLKQEWELGIVSVAKPIAMNAIAKAEGGYVETFSGLEAVWTPSEAYFVGLAPKTLGVMSPANRQLVSRWAAASKKSTGVVASEYLQSAAQRLTTSTPIVLAIDLKDVVPPHVIHQAVAETDVIEAKADKRKEIARVISGIQGITLTLDIGDSVKGTFHFDFSESVMPFTNYAQPLLVEMLKRMGLDLPEVKNFGVALRGNSAHFSGPVPTTSLRRIFSLLEIPTTKFSSVSDDDPKEETNSAAAVSMAYYKSVQSLVDDLRTDLERSNEAHAVWMERYARKIDRLPILNVDEELLAWGAAVGETLRTMALAQRSSGIRAGARKSAIYGNYWYQYDSNGYYTGGRSTESMRNQVRAEERAKANTVRFERWQDLENATAAIRKTMTKKYQVEF